MQDEEKNFVHEKEDDDLLLLEQATLDILVFKPAEYESYSQRVQKQREILFFPNMRRGMYDCIFLYEPIQALSSSGEVFLSLPPLWQIYLVGTRAFSVTVPRLWNFTSQEARLI